MSIFRNSQHLDATDYDDILRAKFSYLSENFEDAKHEAIEEKSLHEGVLLGEEYCSSVRYKGTMFNLNESMSDKVIARCLAKVFVNSIPLDESFVDAHHDGLLNYFVESAGESFNGLYATISSIDNPACIALVEKTDEIVEDAANGITDKDASSGDIEDRAISNVNNTEVSGDEQEAADIVKDKVLSVIENEEAESEKEKQMIQDIMDSKRDGNMITVSENVNSSNSLFRSIFINKYTGVLKGATEGENCGGYALNENNEITVDKDAILAESIIEYTRHELLHTLGITNKTIGELRGMSEAFAAGENIEI